MLVSRRAIVAATIGGGLAVVLTALALYPVFAARAVRDDLAKISKSNFDEGQLRRWAAKHHGQVTCREGHCTASVYISNHVLSMLFLAPRTMFIADLETVDGKLVQGGFYLVEAPYWGKRWPPATQVVIAYDPARHTLPMHDWYVGRGPEGKAPGILYAITPQSSALARARAFSLNLWCLARIGGCSASQQAPEIWALPSTPIPQAGAE